MSSILWLLGQLGILTPIQTLIGAVVVIILFFLVLRRLS